LRFSPSSDVPYLKEVITHLREGISGTPSKNKLMRREDLPYTSSKEFSRSEIAKQSTQFAYIEAVDSDVYRAILPVIAQENYYDEVVSIELIEKETDVYDVTIPSNHLFLSDCYVSHNTKVSNEGAATYIHYRIMHRLHDLGLMTDGAMLEFLQSHTNVVRQPNFDDTNYSGINPYALGFAMCHDIERICWEPTEEDREWFPDFAGCKDEMTILKDCWANYRDESFIRQFLSPKVIRDFKLFRLADNRAEPAYVVTAIHDKRGYIDVRESLADQYERHAFVPQLEVTEVDPTTRTLTVSYTPYRGRTLDNANVMVHHLKALWGYGVTLRADTITMLTN
jgi:hypothetical protein